jgi:glycosyltransferase involved in cell wall biosynthesis
MKICYVSKGDNNHDFRMIKYFSSNFEKSDIYLITYEHLNKKILKNYSLMKIQVIIITPNLPINNKIILYIKLFIALFSIPYIIKKIKPDVLVCAQLFPFGLFGALSSHRPLINITWGSDVLILPKKNAVMKMILRYVLKVSDLIVVNSEVLKIGLGKILPKINDEKSPNYRTILYWNWGMEYLLNYKPNPEKREKKRKELNWNKNTIVLSNRWLDPIYRVQKLIEIIPDLVKKDPNLRFLIIGDGSLYHKFKSFINNNKCSKYVHFTGKIEHSEMVQFLNAADIFISVSSSDSQSYALIEAIFMGIPCIASKLPGYLEIIEHDKNAIIIDPNNNQEFEDAILKLVNDNNKKPNFESYNKTNVIPLIISRIDDSLFQFAIKKICKKKI